MIQDRWRPTRARLQQETGATDTTGLWSRIDASRRAGKSVELPANDPRRPVSPILLGILLLVAIAGVGNMRHRMTSVVRDSAPAASADQDALMALEWLPTPAFAQGTSSSSLPKIDPPTLSRVTPRQLVYRFTGGADGETTEQHGTDTIRISRDTVAGESRIIATYNSIPRRTGTLVRLSYSGVDSLVLTSAGRFQFLKSSYSRNDRPQARLQRNLLLSRDSIAFVGYNARLGTAVSRKFLADFYFFFEDPFVALLPAIAFREGYARSFSLLDLLGGETSPGFRRHYELRVTGQQTIRVPAGTFRCWTVELSDGEPAPSDTASGLRFAEPTRLYVDTEGGSLVRAIWKQPGGFFREQVLMEQQIADQPDRD